MPYDPGNQDRGYFFACASAAGIVIDMGAGTQLLTWDPSENAMKPSLASLPNGHVFIRVASNYDPASRPFVFTIARAKCDRSAGYFPNATLDMCDREWLALLYALLYAGCFCGNSQPSLYCLPVLSAIPAISLRCPCFCRSLLQSPLHKLQRERWRMQRQYPRWYEEFFISLSPPTYRVALCRNTCPVLSLATPLPVLGTSCNITGCLAGYELTNGRRDFFCSFTSDTSSEAAYVAVNGTTSCKGPSSLCTLRLRPPGLSRKKNSFPLTLLQSSPPPPACEAGKYKSAGDDSPCQCTLPRPKGTPRAGGVTESKKKFNTMLLSITFCYFSISTATISLSFGSSMSHKRNVCTDSLHPRPNLRRKSGGWAAVFAYLPLSR